MEILWAPWRMEYIQDVDKSNSSCIFCVKPQQDDDRQNLILYRGQYNFIILNKYPYNNGHCMVVPYPHVSQPNLVDSATSQELWLMMNLCRNALIEAFHPDGFNIGMNIGRIAGAGIDHHIHLHIVPRWNGDTNFMPVIAETKIISQAIFQTYDSLLSSFKKCDSIA
ncbi:MAG: HIT domain-containing protein [Chitinivibrionales bacterium]|nr:HIT domain-containing protein [Chitinivibrionales bacterium]